MTATLQQIIEALAVYPGLRLKRFTTGVQTDATGDYEGVATGADAKRRLVSTDLADVDESGLAATTDVSWYRDAYLWLPETAVQRKIAPNGYETYAEAATETDQAGSTEVVGVVTVTRTMGAAVAAGVEAQIHWPFPPLTEDDDKVSLRNRVNRALDVIRDRVTISLTATSGATRYSLSAYPWIAHEDELAGVRDREVVSDRDSGELPGESYLRFDGGVAYLNLGTPVVADATFYLDVWRRRSTWIDTGSGFATSAVGLVAADDACLGNAEDIAAVAYALLCDDLSIRDEQGTDTAWALRRQMVEDRVRPYLQWRQGRTRRPKPVSAAAMHGGGVVYGARRRWQ